MSPHSKIPTPTVRSSDTEKSCADAQDTKRREDIFSRKRSLLSDRPESTKVYPFVGLWLALTALTFVFAYFCGTRVHGTHGLRLAWCCPRCILTEVIIVSVVSTVNIYLIWRAWNRYN